MDRLVESSLTPSHPGPWRTGEVPVDTREVRAALPTLLELADRLRTCSEATPRGVAMVDELLRDGAGPLYVHMHDGDVDEAAGRALAALG